VKDPSFDKGIKIRKAVLGAEHVETPLRNDCTREEGREVLLQAAVYCGVPAAVDAFRFAKEAFAALDGDTAAT